MNKSIFLLPFMATCTPLNAQTQVTTFNPGVAANGVTYALARTQLCFDAKAIKTVYTPGEFSRYAERYLHVHNVAQEPDVAYHLQSITLRTQGVVDTTKVYTVKLKEKTTAPMVELSDEGLLLAVNSPESHTVDRPWVGGESRSTHHQLNPKQYFTEEIMAAASTAKMAELVAAEIYDIRDSRNSIMRGQVDAMPKDGESMRLVLDRLNQQEEALMQLFVGYVDTIDVAHTFTVMPEADIQRQVLFRFSRKLGFLDTDDLAGEPFYLTLQDQHSVTLPTKKETEKRHITGLVYNLPSQTQVTLQSADRTWLSATQPIAQFGTIDQLAPTLFNKGAATTVILHPSTSAIQKLLQN